MSIRFSRWATGLFAVAIVAVLAGQCWAIYYGLAPSKDDWQIKYDVDVSDAGSDKLNVVFDLADEGRLKPFYSIELIALSKHTDNQGGRSYEAKAKFALQPTEDGTRAGQVQIPKSVADNALIRILTLNVDGRRQSSAHYYDIPLKKFLQQQDGK